MDRKWNELPGIPSHGTFNRVLQLIEQQALEAFEGRGRVVGTGHGRAARDCGGRKDVARESKGGKAIHLLNAWAEKTRVVIGQRLVDGKSNEIVALPKLLESLFWTVAS